MSFYFVILRRSCSDSCYNFVTTGSTRSVVVGSCTIVTRSMSTSTITATTTTIMTTCLTKSNQQKRLLLCSSSWRSNSAHQLQSQSQSQLQLQLLSSSSRSLSSSNNTTIVALYTLRGLYRSFKTPILPESVLGKYNTNNNNNNQKVNNDKDSITKSASKSKSIVVTNKNRSNVTTKFLLDEYRKYNNNNNINSKKNNNNNTIVNDISNGTYKLKYDIKERQRLHLLDTGVEELLSPMEMSRRAAARAGLLLPETNDEMFTRQANIIKMKKQDQDQEEQSKLESPELQSNIPNDEKNKSK